MQVIFIDGSNKPKQIVDSEWPVEGKQYTLKKVYRMGLQPNTFGFELLEISLSELSTPYELYDSRRFGILIGGPITEEVFKEEDIELETL